ncbi:MAG: tetratricopeptide repeat protein [Calditrichia bacterium]|nr:tetratricopeptide repeat protein [Calditrichia bacterium]
MKKVIYIFSLIFLFSLLVNAQSNKNIKQEYAFIYGLYEDGMYEEAARAADMFLSKFGENNYSPDARYLKADAYFLIQDFKQAAKEFGVFEKKYPLHRLADDAALRQGQALLQQGNANKASATFFNAIEKHKHSNLIPEFYYWYGEAEFKINHYNTALTAYGIINSNYQEHLLAPYALYSSGWLYSEQDKTDDAIRSFKSLIEKYPDSDVTLESYFILGDLLYKYQQYQEAIDIIFVGLKKDIEKKYHPKGMLILAECMYSQKNYDKALEIYDKLITGYPQTTQKWKAWYAKGWTLFQMKEYDKAYAEFSSLISETEDDNLVAKANFFMGMCRKKTNQLDEALTIFEKVVKKFPKSDYRDDAYYEMGLIYFEQEDFDTALENFQLVITINQDNILKELSVKGMADCYFRMDNSEKGLQLINSYEFKNPKLLSKTLFEAGYSFFKKGDFAKAGKYFNIVIQSTDNDSLKLQSLYWRGETNYQTANYEETVKDLNEYLNSGYSSQFEENALYSLGWAYYNHDQFNSALKAFKKFEQQFPGSKFKGDIQIRKADVLFYMKKFPVSRKEYQSFLKSHYVHKEKDWAQYQIAITYFKEKQFSRSRNELNDFLASNPQRELREKATYMIGRTWFLQNKFQQAMSEFQNTINKFPNGSLNDRIHYEIGDCYYNLKKYEDAIKWYKMTIHKFPDSPVVVDALGGLQWASLQLGKEQEAFVLVEKYISDNKNNPRVSELAFREGDYYYSSKNYEKSLHSYQNLSRKFNNVPQIYYKATYWAGMSHFKLKQYESAIQLFKKIKSAGNSNTYFNDAMYQTAKAHLQIGQWTKGENAITTLLTNRQQLQRSPGLFADIYLLKGQLELSANNYPAAEKSWKEAINKGNNSYGAYEARCDLASLYLSQNKNSRAESMLNEVLQTRDDELAARAQFLRGNLAVKQGDDPKAILEYLKVKTLYRGFAEWVAKSLMEASKIYKQQGKTDKAEKLKDEVKENYPQYYKELE